MIKIKDAQFIRSIVRLSDRPEPALPEFAFAGRSNVGKSSLINSLMNRKNYAKVSKQPGKTRTINYFRINSQFYLVDLPGYGFARVPGKEKENWRKMIEEYLLNSPDLVALFVLIDSVVGPQKNDIQLVEWLKYHRIPFQIVATKTDKLSRSKLALHLRQLREKLQLPQEQIVISYSAKTNTGKGELLSLMNYLLRN